MTKRHRLTIRLPEELYERLVNYASEASASINTIVNDAISYYISCEDWRLAGVSVLGIPATKINYVVQRGGSEDALSLICQYSKVPMKIVGWTPAATEVEVVDGGRSFVISVPRGLNPKQIITLISSAITRHRTTKIMEELL